MGSEVLQRREHERTPVRAGPGARRVPLRLVSDQDRIGWRCARAEPKLSLIVGTDGEVIEASHRGNEVSVQDHSTLVQAVGRSLELEDRRQSRTGGPWWELATTARFGIKIVENPSRQSGIIRARDAFSDCYRMVDLQERQGQALKSVDTPSDLTQRALNRSCAI